MPNSNAARDHGKRDYRFRLGTVEHHADDLRREEIRKEMKKYGIEMFSDSRKISTPQLEEILKVLRS